VFNEKDEEKMQGHWLLAKMGKKVLRPGGRELTQKLVRELNITNSNNVVEFAPGLGFTANLTLKHDPHSYTGVDADPEAVRLLQSKFKGNNIHFIESNAAKTPIQSESKDRVYGEAMLTMQADHRKAEIVCEAARILKKGGLYGIHELGLTPDDLNEETKAKIQRELAQTIRVNARPLTESEWKQILENNGFKVKEIFKAPMRLLETKRIIDDEGIMRTLKITFNILRNGKARKRILDMRKVFQKYDSQMNAIAIIAEKI